MTSAYAWNLLVLAGVGHAALGVLLVSCAAISWWTARRQNEREQRWARFWTTAPWLATVALALVVGLSAALLQGTWALGLESGWFDVRTTAQIWSHVLPACWLSLAFALGSWSLLVSWPTALGLDRLGRRLLALGLLCFWLGLGFAAWSCRDFLGKLPLVLVPSSLPFEALDPSRARLARGILVAGAGLALAAGLVAWALWRAPEKATTRSRWLVTLSIAVIGGAASFGLERMGTRFAWENAHPIDPSIRFNCSICMPSALGLEGRAPHKVQGPQVELRPPHWRVDGNVVRNVDELFKVLKAKQDLWRQINPGGEVPPGNVVLSARGLGTVAELEPALSTVLRAGFPKAHLLYTEVMRQDRPILGALGGRRDTALRLFLARGLSDCPTPYAHAIHTAVAAKRSGAAWLHELKSVNGNICVLLPPWRCPPELRGCHGVAAAGFEVMRQWSIGKRVEAAELRREQEQYLVAFVAPGSTIAVEQMNDPSDPWDGFEALEARAHRAGQRVVWAMNAGMYHADRSPVGLLVSDSNARSALNTRRGKGNFFLTPNGVFEVSNRGAAVLTTSQWQDAPLSSRQPKEATQSGPMLVIDGELHPAFERDSPSRLIRNGIGVVGDSNMVVMAISTTRVNFYEFAALMRDLGCANALYLDGNVSSVFAPELERRDRGLGLGPVVLAREADD